MEAKDQHTQHDRNHIDEAEVSELQYAHGFYDKVRERAEHFASTRLGQVVIKRADRALKVIEDTARWSLPQEKNSNAEQLQRPLPWLPFLLLIILLRQARFALTMGALLLGNGPVSAADMIYFIQTRRRKLHGLRLHGLKVMRHRQEEASSNSGCSFTQKFSQWLNRAICRPGVQRANSERVLVVRGSQQQQTGQMNQTASKRPRDEDPNQDQNLTINELLSKYANLNSEDDSDYVPNPQDESESSSNDSDSLSSEETSNEEPDHAEEHKKQNGIHKKKETQPEKEKELEQVQRKKEQEKHAKTTTSNGGNDTEQTEVGNGH